MIAMVCLAAASGPRYTVKRGTITRRKLRRRDCAQDGASSSKPNMNLNLNEALKSSLTQTAEPTDTSDDTGETNVDSDASSSSEPSVNIKMNMAIVQNSDSTSATSITDTDGETDTASSQDDTKPSGSVDPNALVSPDDPRVNHNATVVGKKDPSLADYKDSGITFDGMIGQYNVNNDACLSKSTDNDLVAALNKLQYEELVDKNNNPVRCQECIMIHGDKGDVEVTIVDECPQCEDYMLNLSPAAYALATSQATSATITWEFVVCSAESFSKTRPDKNSSTTESDD
ncbi:hypothetical protein GGH96_005345 [Coemansia sp. RSA 1972]|nr:hypothetical protein GGH96_005345 [Coemansia sp. RSA 1972]